MSLRRVIVSIATGAALAAPPMVGAVLCQKRSGVLVVRESCKRKERVADPVALGLQGPPGAQGPQGTPGVGPLTACPPDAVLVGPTCIDRFEASLWQLPPTATAALTAIRSGTVTLADLTAAGATQVGCTDFQFNHAAIPATFPQTGNWTTPVYAASIPGVLPSACVTWFQAEQACALSTKRLATNQEWQRAAAGTPDSGVDDGTTLCNVGATGFPSNTGSRSTCVSSWGTFDMVGNVDEWVADWGDLATDCTYWDALFGTDYSCVGGDGSINIPGALTRGGDRGDGTDAGVFSVRGGLGPSGADDFKGFRCAR
jgi:formylglycine-generating enzyme required for sulfatase activity